MGLTLLWGGIRLRGILRGEALILGSNPKVGHVVVAGVRLSLHFNDVLVNFVYLVRFWLEIVTKTYLL